MLHEFIIYLSGMINRDDEILSDIFNSKILSLKHKEHFVKSIEKYNKKAGKGAGTIDDNYLTEFDKFDSFMNSILYIRFVVYKNLLISKSSLLRILGRSIQLYLLDPYMSKLCQIENEMMQSQVANEQPGTLFLSPISRIHYLLGEYLIMFPAIERYLKELNNDDDFMNKPHILDSIYAASLNGVPCLQRLFSEIFIFTSSELLRLIANWIDRGELSYDEEDNHNHFFIQERRYKIQSLIPTKKQEIVDKARLTEKTVYAISNEKKSNEQDWKTRFIIDIQFLPMRYILSIELAEKILFIGKVERLIFNEGDDKSYHHAMQKESRFAEEVRALLNKSRRERSLNVKELHSLIQTTYLNCTDHLLKNLMLKEKLLERIKFARDVFLLGRGDFFRALVFESIKSKESINNKIWKRVLNNFFSDSVSTIDSAFQDIKSIRVEEITQDDIYHIENPIIWSSKENLEEIEKKQLLTLTGSACINQEEKQSITFSKHDPGAVWLTSKQLVEDGFQCEFDMMINLEETSHGTFQSSSLFVFAIHHCIRFGPSILYDYDIVNGILLKFDFGKGHLFITTKNSLTQNETQLYAAEFLRIKKNIDRIKLSIRYNQETSKINVDIQGRNVSDRFVINLSKTMSLERGSGRAWVGCMSIPQNLSYLLNALQNEIGRPYQTEFSIHTWKFTIPKKLEILEAQTIKLNWNLNWPLQLIFSDDILDKYNILFRFLLSVLKTGDDINRVWRLLSTPLYRMNKSSAILHSIWQLRASMSFLIDTLQFHLQIDVVDTMIANLLQSIESTKQQQLDDLIELHGKYLQQLTIKCMIHNRIVRMGMNHVFKWCEHFCEMIEAINNKIEGNSQLIVDEVFEEYKADIETVSKGFFLDAKELCDAWEKVNPELALRIPQQAFDKEGKA